MNKIEKMIKEMCPNGVEYKTIESVTNYEQPGPYIVKDTNYKEEYDIPVLTAGQTFILGYTNEKNGIYDASIEKPVIIFDDFTTANKWVDFNFKVKSSAMKIVKSKDENNLLIRFLFHLIQNINYVPENHERQWIAKYSQFKIPVPPIEIQREIVRILDNFTSLTAELTAELTARNKQYEYYRDRLLNEGVAETSMGESKTCMGDDKTRRSDDKACGGEASRARKYKLGEIGKFYGGLSGKSKEDFKDGNEKYITYMNVFMNSSIDININDKVKILSNEKQNVVEYGDIIFTGSSETQNECGMSSVLVNEVGEKLYLNSFCFGYRLNDKNLLLPQYAKYLFRSSLVRKQIIKTASGVTRFNVSKAKMENVEIYIPDIIIQKKIAGVLDNFESICKDLNIGLPAEIEARKKQYEYYRDSLLKFAETGNVEFVEREREREVALYKLIQYVWGYVELSIEDVCNNITSGGTPSSKNSLYYGGNIPWLRTQEVDFKAIEKTEMFITKEGFKNSSAKWIPENCVIVAMYGATVGKVAYNKIPLTTNQACCNLEINVNLANYKYVYYWLVNKYEYIKSLGQGSQTNINAQIVKDLKIVLPSLNNQISIVNTLDKLDTLCNDLTSGLPAEIEARKKQYEYYRDKLLSFE